MKFLLSVSQKLDHNNISTNIFPHYVAVRSDECYGDDGIGVGHGDGADDYDSVEYYSIFRPDWDCLQ